MKGFEFNNKKYKLIDFDEKATVRMEMVANSVLMGTISTIVANGSNVSLANFFKALTEKAPIIEILCLIYWEEEQEKFDEKKWKKQSVEFLDLPKKVKDDCLGEVENFLDGIGTSFLAGFQIFNGLLTPKKTED